MDTNQTIIKPANVPTHAAPALQGLQQHPLDMRRPHRLPVLDQVIEIADAAMAAQRPARIVPQLVEKLQVLFAADPRLAGDIPASLQGTSPDGYLRRELYRSPQFGYHVFLMTWAPGQHSPIHDHADVWGIEAVLKGELEVVDYRMAGRRDALVELHPVGHHQMTPGSVIGLLPPHDLHACGNVVPDGVTVSLHIYGHHMEEVQRYAHVENLLYRPQSIFLESI